MMRIRRHRSDAKEASRPPSAALVGVIGHSERSVSDSGLLDHDAEFVGCVGEHAAEVAGVDGFAHDGDAEDGVSVGDAVVADDGKDGEGGVRSGGGIG